MEFELNEYHRDISDQELLDDLIRAIHYSGKSSLTMNEYNSIGKYSASTFQKRFCGWKNALRRCGVELSKSQRNEKVDDDSLLDDLRRVAFLLGEKTVTRDAYTKHGMYHGSTVEHRFGSWNNALRTAGLEITLDRNVTNRMLLEEIERVWILLGRQPTSSDIKNGISDYSLHCFSDRFGGWRGALQAFIEYINNPEEDDSGQLHTHDEPLPEMVEDSVSLATHETKREVNLRIRFLVMKRDNFKCCICGSSPAKDPAVELQIDHIIPWSKGGETVMENLQTLCNRCNLGKSNLQV